MRLSGKRALVTGAAGGIGSAIIARLQAEGAVVAAADLDLTNTSAEHTLTGDLTNTAYADQLPVRAAEALGGLDILINNAGIMKRGTVTENSDDDYAVSMAINVEAPFRLCRSAIPIMEKQGGGVIINTASCWGVHPGPGHALYCMTKAAIASLTQCMGRDHAHQGIRVNAVCPNEVDTPMLRTGFERRGYNPDTAIAELGKTVPVGHVALPGEIADVVIFLASEESRYICGALIEVNGGKPVG